jgi:hypothetical protein
LGSIAAAHVQRSIQVLIITDVTFWLVKGTRSGLRSYSSLTLSQEPRSLDSGREVQYNYFVVLDGEVAVPCTRNPLQRGRIPI